LGQFFEVIEAVLKRTSPNAPPAQVRAVSQGISATYVNLDSLTQLNPPEAWREELKQAATILAASLEVTV
jgi:hypothetical protein